MAASKPRHGNGAGRSGPVDVPVCARVMAVAIVVPALAAIFRQLILFVPNQFR